jgi:acyl-coenzyme A thioesterase PaaI-like protein
MLSMPKRACSDDVWLTRTADADNSFSHKLKKKWQHVEVTMNDRTLNASREVLNEAHPNCVVCGPKHLFGMRLAFALLPDGSVQASFHRGEAFEGYPGLLHGGIISSLLDGAMTNCLYAHGQRGVTGELKVRFQHPVTTNRDAVVRAWIHDSSPPLHVLKAEVIQDELRKANATGKFMELTFFELRQRQLEQAGPSATKGIWWPTA